MKYIQKLKCFLGYHNWTEHCFSKTRAVFVVCGNCHKMKKWYPERYNWGEEE